MLEGINAARKREYKRLVVQVDNKQLFEALTLSFVEKGPGLNLIRRIRKITSNNGDICIVHIYREVNNCVNVLARHDIYLSGGLLVYEECP